MTRVELDAGRINRWEHLDNLQLSPGRKIIVNSLKERNWFRNTGSGLQLELSLLPQEGKESHDGFLVDLARRPEEMGGIRVLSMSKLARGNFALIPQFAVENVQNGTQYTYEYVSWRYGPESGAKGIVYVQGGDGKLSHFIVLKGDKFATGKREWDSVGGFIDLNSEGVKNALQRIRTEVQEELGVEDLSIKNTYDLGNLAVDPGMTNNRPKLFAAVIDGAEATKVSAEPINPDVFELKSGALVVPIAQLPDVILNNGDAFFHACVTRSAAMGIIGFDQLSAMGSGNIDAFDVAGASK